MQNHMTCNHIESLQGICKYMIGFKTQKCNCIIYIFLNIYYLNNKIIILYIYIIVNFNIFNLYHVDMCHYIG
jgi:hypothetical protein